MKRTEIGKLPNFFDRYINLVEEDIDLIDALVKYHPKQILDNIDIYTKIGEKIYAPGKWTIKDIVQHCIDTERIMCYRAMSFARNDENELPGFDEQNYANNTVANTRTYEDLIHEYSILRESTICLFKNFNKTMMLRKGVANKSRIAPLSLGFVIIGHLLHHDKVIRERYYDL